MWWHADLPAALPGFASASEPPSEPAAQGEFLLEWILPSLSEDVAARADPDAATGAERRQLRRELRDED